MWIKGSSTDHDESEEPAMFGTDKLIALVSLLFKLQQL